MITRRSFLSLSGAGGLLVVAVPACKTKDKGKTAPATEEMASSPPDEMSSATYTPPSAPPLAGQGGGQISAWIHIADNDVITYFVPEAEMGQGVHTAVAMIIGAELGGAWKNAVATTAPLNAEVFGRQSTGGSTSIRLGFGGFRKAGAAARELLIAAGAKAMKVPPDECRAADSMVSWANGAKSVRFGEIAEAASQMQLSAKPRLRTAIHLGEDTLRLDTFDKVTGRATYGMDVQVPGMLIASTAHPPTVGARLAGLDDTAAREMAGVRDVVKTSVGVAVVADHTWAAMKGRDALRIEWKEPHLDLDDEAIDGILRKGIDRGRSFYSSGNAGAALRKSETVVEAEYSVPYLAHAPMEPLCCTVDVQKDRCDIWTGTQGPSGAAGVAAEITKLPLEAIFVHGQFLGGGFGRRSQPDYVREAVEVAKASGKPVKLVWDRENDIRGYQYRPIALNKMRAAVDPDAGKLLAWEHAIASPSILKQFGPLRGGIDGTSVDGTVKYAVPDMSVTYSDADLPVPTWFWRSVGHSQNCFVVDGFMNEAAKAAGRDPLEFRLDTQIARLNDAGEVEDNARLRKVLEVAAEKSGWGKALPAGMARGIAACESFGSFVAQVAEVSIDKGKPRVHRVFCVIDCGRQVNPLTIRAQMEGGIAYGLSAALYGDIRFDKGRVVQGNFDTYRVVRIGEMPSVETTIIDSSEAHGGVGEPATPPIAAALVGGLFALQGTPPRRLPLVSS